MRFLLGQRLEPGSRITHARDQSERQYQQPQ